jgi:GT2 family glycosyltransferase
MKIGIGVTTYKRPKCLAKWLEQVDKTYTNDYVIIHVAEDTDEDRRGVAYRKNECLRALKDCDYVFLFDDDCYPIQAGWIKFFIYSGYEHLIYCDPKFHGLRNEIGNLLVYNDCGGVFMFMAKSAIERVGGFNEDFGLYGFEHAEYSNRILNSRAYPVLKGTENYIYAEDYSNPKHKSSITQHEKMKLVFSSINVYNKPISNQYISFE